MSEQRPNEREVDTSPPTSNKHCLRDGQPCAPAGDGGCMACDDGLGNYNQKHVDCDCMECRPWTT